MRAAKHRCAADVQAAADEVEKKVMRRYPELAAQSNDKETSGVRNLAVTQFTPCTQKFDLETTSSRHNSDDRLIYNPWYGRFL